MKEYFSDIQNFNFVNIAEEFCFIYLPSTTVGGGEATPHWKDNELMNSVP